MDTSPYPREVEPAELPPGFDQLADAIDMFTDAPTPENFHYVLELANAITTSRDYPRHVRSAMSELMIPFWEAAKLKLPPKEL